MNELVISINDKFGKLRIKESLITSKGSHKRVTWICDCGKETTQEIRYVLNGRSKDCRKCNLLSSSHMASTKYGSLRILNPIDCLPASEKTIQWVCDCGNEPYIMICNVISGRNKTCGKCNILSKEYLEKTKFGKLTVISPEETKPYSNKKIRFLCDCGNETITTFNLVSSGKTSSCGRCNSIPSSYFKTKKFGKLKLKDPTELQPNSDKQLVWICDCGNETKPFTHNVLKGLTRSCGKCVETVREWINDNRSIINSLSFPINQSDFPSGGITPLEPIKGRTISFRAICFVCQSEFYPKLCNILDKPQLTCGCSTNRISNSVRKIHKFMKSLGVDSSFEFKVCKLKYDIYVPSNNLLIEFNGLKWHSFPESRERDLKKYENAIKNGFDYLMIYEDEWIFNKEKVKSLIKNKLQKNDSVSLRPSKCEIREISSKEANEFYESYHYIGKTKSSVYYGIFFKNELIACCSFGKPTRQTSKHSWELLRMASNPKYRIHGIWSKVLKMFKSSYSGSIVSFSDNRLFSGAVYGKMGFHLDGSIKPDYYWVKGSRRYHKSGLRKTPEERKSGLTETQLREAQGYRKIYDLGKKRWVLS